MKKPQIRSTMTRLIWLLITALIVCQVFAYASMVLIDKYISREDFRSDLATSIEIFKYAANERAEHLRQAAGLAAKDFGFREAIASDKRLTLDSAVDNQRDRVKASIAVITSLDDRLTGYAVEKTLAGPPHSLDAPLDEVIKTVNAATLSIRPFALTDGRVNLYQWVQSVVSAPRPIANVFFGFEINDEAVRRFKKITGSDFMFLSRRSGGPWYIHASSFPQEITSRYSEDYSPIDPESSIIPTASGEYGIQRVELNKHADEETIMVVGRPLDPIFVTARKWEWVSGALVLFSIVFTSVVLYRLTRNIVEPIDAAAFTDEMTGLANKRLFDMHVELAAQNLVAFRKGYALLMMDLNKFKAVNDTYGHSAGDKVLIAVGSRLKTLLRNSDLVARLGGDEFTVLLATEDRAKITQIAETISRAVREPIVISLGLTVEVGSSIGIAFAPGDGGTSAEVLKKADAAMYAAKQAGRPFAFAERPTA